MIQLPLIPPMSIRWESIWAKNSVTHWTQLHFFLFLNTAIFSLLDLKLLNHKVLQEIKSQHSHTLTEQNRMIFLCIPIMRCCVYRWSTERDWFVARWGVMWYCLLSFRGTNDSRSMLVLNTELVLSYWERNVVKSWGTGGRSAAGVWNSMRSSGETHEESSLIWQGFIHCFLAITLLFCFNMEGKGEIGHAFSLRILCIFQHALWYIRCALVLTALVVPSVSVSRWCRSNPTVCNKNQNRKATSEFTVPLSCPSLLLSVCEHSIKVSSWEMNHLNTSAWLYNKKKKEGRKKLKKFYKKKNMCQGVILN